ncbi:MAG: tetratricopeptide repeat protein [Acidobacteriaceae bacterium]|jgi:Flp pilus assembly protein TadD
MLSTRVTSFAALAFGICIAVPPAFCGDLKIVTPRRSEFTPVQRLNRDGVEAVRKGHYDRAEALFYKAYLFDPSDPFTLNNLGYVSELEGQPDRALNYYKLAGQQGCDAKIDLSSAKSLQGQPMTAALLDMKNAPMRMDRLNVEAMQMLEQRRPFEAQALLRQSLAIDPGNPFTLNNMGVAEEAIGDDAAALGYYDAAAATRSKEPATMTLRPGWQGRSISEVAAAGGDMLRQRMRSTNMTQARAAMLALQGVTEVNRNNWEAARKDFLEEYSLDPYSAFALNNLGYVAERDGDMETAQLYYAKARQAADAGQRVGKATRLSAQGRSLSAVATDSNVNVDNALQTYTQERRREQAPIQLIPRGDPYRNGNAPPSTSPQPQQ